LRLLGTCTEFIGNHPDRVAVIHEQADLILAAGEQEIAQPEDVVALRAGFDAVERHLPARPATAPPTPAQDAPR
jgi:hypothetical protein